jgi:hypothetical protein
LTPGQASWLNAVQQKPCLCKMANAHAAVCGLKAAEARRPRHDEYPLLQACFHFGVEDPRFRPSDRLSRSCSGVAATTTISTGKRSLTSQTATGTNTRRPVPPKLHHAISICHCRRGARVSSAVLSPLTSRLSTQHACVLHLMLPAALVALRAASTCCSITTGSMAHATTPQL